MKYQLPQEILAREAAKGWTAFKETELKPTASYIKQRIGDTTKSILHSLVSWYHQQEPGVNRSIHKVVNVLDDVDQKIESVPVIGKVANIQKDITKHAVSYVKTKWQKQSRSYQVWNEFAKKYPERAQGIQVLTMAGNLDLYYERGKITPEEYQLAKRVFPDLTWAIIGNGDLETVRIPLSEDVEGIIQKSVNKLKKFYKKTKDPAIKTKIETFENILKKKEVTPYFEQYIRGGVKRGLLRKPADINLDKDLIQRLYRSGHYNVDELAESFKVKPKTISKIVAKAERLKPRIPKFGKALATKEQQNTILNSVKELELSKKQFSKVRKLWIGEKDINKLTRSDAETLIKVLQNSWRSGERLIYPKNPSELVLAEKRLLGQMKKVGAIGRWIRPPQRVLQSVGADDVYQKISRADYARIAKVESYTQKYRDLFKGIKRGSKSDKRIWNILNKADTPEKIVEVGKKMGATEREISVAKTLREDLINFLNRINETRVKIGLKPIKPRKNYISWIYNDTIQDIVKRNKTMPDEIVANLDWIHPKATFNKYLQRRLGKGVGLEESAIHSMESYMRYALRTIHMDPAIAEVRPQLRFLPGSAQSYVNTWIDEKILGRWTKSDTLITNTLEELGKYISHIPVVGKKIAPKQGNTARRVASFGRRLSYAGTMALRPVLALRNLTQGLLTYAELGGRYTTKGYSTLFTKEGKNILKEADILKGRIPIEGISLTGVGNKLNKLVKSGMYLYQGADYINVGAAYLGGYYKALDMGLDKAAAKYYANEIAKWAQYSYRSIDMPMAFNSGIGSLFMQFKSWPINYAEFLSHLIHSKNYVGLTKYMIVQGLFIDLLKEKLGIDYTNITPIYILSPWKSFFPPTISLANNIGLWARAMYKDKPEEAEKYWNKVEYNAIAHIPFGLISKQTWDTLKTYENNYAVYDKRGNLKYKVSPDDLIKSFFFYPAYKTEQQRLYEMIESLQENYNVNRQKIIRTMQENPNEAVKIAKKWNEEAVQRLADIIETGNIEFTPTQKRSLVKRYTLDVSEIVNGVNRYLYYNRQVPAMERFLGVPYQSPVRKVKIIK